MGKKYLGSSSAAFTTRETGIDCYFNKPRLKVISLVTEGLNQDLRY